MDRLIEFDVVRIVALVGSAESHLAVSGADRPPQVGHLGTVIQLVPTNDPDDPATHYLVQCGDGSRRIWIAEFGREELTIESAAER